MNDQIFKSSVFQQHKEYKITATDCANHSLSTVDRVSPPSIADINASLFKANTHDNSVVRASNEF